MKTETQDAAHPGHFCHVSLAGTPSPNLGFLKSKNKHKDYLDKLL